jgi:hypothetical protein
MKKKNQLINKVKHLLRKIKAPTYLHRFGPKIYKLWQHIFALFFKANCKLSYRRTSFILRQLGFKVATKSTLQRYSQKLKLPFWRKLFQLTTNSLSEIMAIDGTGLDSLNVSPYYQTNTYTLGDITITKISFQNWYDNSDYAYFGCYYTVLKVDYHNGTVRNIKLAIRDHYAYSQNGDFKGRNYCNSNMPITHTNISKDEYLWAKGDFNGTPSFKTYFYETSPVIKITDNFSIQPIDVHGCSYITFGTCGIYFINFKILINNTKNLIDFNLPNDTKLVFTDENHSFTAKIIGVNSLGQLKLEFNNGILANRGNDLAFS